jgi:hypothetical protein
MEITPLICSINPHDAEKIPPKRNVLRCERSTALLLPVYDSETGGRETVTVTPL